MPKNSRNFAFHCLSLTVGGLLQGGGFFCYLCLVSICWQRRHKKKKKKDISLFYQGTLLFPVYILFQYKELNAKQQTQG